MAGVPSVRGAAPAAGGAALRGLAATVSGSTEDEQPSRRADGGIWEDDMADATRAPLVTRRVLAAGARCHRRRRPQRRAEAAAQAAAPPMAGTVPLVLPRTEFVYEAVFDLAPTLNLGDSPLGERRMVPITGGSFEGPNIRGNVLPGGADRQLIRKDGVRQLDALYELQADDGAIITVRNRVLIDDPGSGRPRYAFSTLGDHRARGSACLAEPRGVRGHAGQPAAGARRGADPGLQGGVAQGTADAGAVGGAGDGRCVGPKVRDCRPGEGGGGVMANGRAEPPRRTLRSWSPLCSRRSDECPGPARTGRDVRGRMRLALAAAVFGQIPRDRMRAPGVSGRIERSGLRGWPTAGVDSAAFGQIEGSQEWDGAGPIGRRPGRGVAGRHGPILSWCSARVRGP